MNPAAPVMRTVFLFSLEDSSAEKSVPKEKKPTSVKFIKNLEKFNLLPLIVKLFQNVIKEKN